MKYIVHVLIAALFIFSCSTAKVTHIEEPKNDSLFGRRFKLVSLYPDMGITIEFTPDTIHGFNLLRLHYLMYYLYHLLKEPEQEKKWLLKLII